MKISAIAFAVAALSINCLAANVEFDKYKTLHPKEINMQKAMRRMAPEADAFSSARMELIAKTNAKMGNDSHRHRIEADYDIKPSSSIGPLDSFYDIDGPNGETWYCTTQLYWDYVEHQFYTERILREYKFEIFDKSFHSVGTVYDKMRYTDNEVRVAGDEQGISLLPMVTKNYFNSDENYEVVVSLAVNTTREGYNHYRSVIYSLGGEKETVTIMRNNVEETVEVDKPIGQMNSFVADVLDASANGQETIYMTFMSDMGSEIDIDFEKLIDGDADEGEKYWQVMNSSGTHYTTYAKVDGQNKLVKVLDNPVRYMQWQGDQENTPAMITFMRDGKPYILSAKYKESFFNPFYSPYDDMTMRENNVLQIQLYQISGTEATLIDTTEIPVEKGAGESVLATYYSVGDLRYGRDVEFDAAGKPIYTVTRCNYTTASDETSGYCFYKYDSNGNKILTLFENCESRMPLCDVPGNDDQVVFVNYNEGYIYNFVDLSVGYNKKKTVKIDYLLDMGDDDPEVLSFNLDRVPMGDTYKYAFEMRTPLVDEDDNDYIRIAWFNADGSFDRIDHVAMGSSVLYATAYVKGYYLNPDFLAAGPEQEYMILVKRGISDETSQSQEELIIAQPTAQDLSGGKTILHLLPGDKGKLVSIDPYPAANGVDPHIAVIYQSEAGYSADFYYLPFDLSSIESIEKDSENFNGFSFDGASIATDGAIAVYNAQGVLVASGRGSVDVANLPVGVYVAVSGDTKVKFLNR